MRVVVNQLVALGRKTGIGHYTNQLLRGLFAQADSDEIVPFPSGIVRRAYQAASRTRRRLTGDDRRARFASSRAERGASLLNWTFEHVRWGTHAALGRYFRAVCTPQQFQIYHETNVIPFATDLPAISSVHDLSAILHPEWHPRYRVAHYEQLFRRRLKSTAHVLVLSDFIRDQLIRQFHVPPERVTRTYCGVRPGLMPIPEDEVQMILRRLGLPRRFLLYVGTIEPRKNVMMLLRAYVGLPSSIRSQWPLLLVGTWGWNSTDVAEYLHTEARHRGVIHVGYVQERHLPALYGGARALLFPSHYEGFGLPPIEMMACGGAVFASTAGAIVETVGRKAHLIHANDEAGWRDAMGRVVQDDDWWRSLRQGARNVARKYTWASCAAETLAVYRHVAGATNELDLRPRRAAG